MDQWIVSQTGMDTLEILQKIRRPSIDDSTLDALNLTIEQLCCEYRSANPHELIVKGREWLNKMTRLLRENSLTLKQHREVLNGAGQLALLVGCLEYDVMTACPLKVRGWQPCNSVWSREAPISSAGHTR